MLVGVHVALELDLVSLDLQQGWAPYASAMGLKFIGDWDLREGDLVDKCACLNNEEIGCESFDVDIVVISYVLIYTSEESTADMLVQLLQPKILGGGGVKAILISERNHKQAIVSKMNMRSDKVELVHLMPQDTIDGRDDRQLLLLPKGDSNFYQFNKPSNKTTFPNVPYAKGT